MGAAYSLRSDFYQGQPLSIPLMCYSPLTDNGGEALSPAGPNMVIEKSREKESSTQQ